VLLFLLLGRINAPYTAGESLVKPAAVKIARIMHSDAVANKLAMIQLSNNTGHARILSQYSAANYCCYEVKWRTSLQLDEITHLGNDTQFMVFMQYCATKHYVELFLFCHPLAKHSTGEEMFKKVRILLKNISFRGLTTCLFVPMVLHP